MSEYLRMSGLFWGLTTLELLDRPDILNPDEVMEFVLQCINDDGGISPCVGHDPHILYTLSAVQVSLFKYPSLIIIFCFKSSQFAVQILLNKFLSNT